MGERGEGVCVRKVVEVKKETNRDIENVTQIANWYPQI